MKRYNWHLRDLIIRGQAEPSVISGGGAHGLRALRPPSRWLDQGVAASRGMNAARPDRLAPPTRSGTALPVPHADENAVASWGERTFGSGFGHRAFARSQMIHSTLVVATKWKLKTDAEQRPAATTGVENGDGIGHPPPWKRGVPSRAEPGSYLPADSRPVPEAGSPGAMDVSLDSASTASPCTSGTGRAQH